MSFLAPTSPFTLPFKKTLHGVGMNFVWITHLIHQRQRLNYFWLQPKNWAHDSPIQKGGWNENLSTDGLGKLWFERHWKTNLCKGYIHSYNHTLQIICNVSATGVKKGRTTILHVCVILHWRVIYYYSSMEYYTHK